MFSLSSKKSTSLIGDAMAGPTLEYLRQEEILESLIEAARTSEGRADLASSGTTVVAVLCAIRATTRSRSLLTQQLRLLRNLCAGDEDNQNAFIAAGGSALVAAVLMEAPPEVVKVGLQMLTNVCFSSEEHRAAVWAAMFPDVFLGMARIAGSSGVIDPLCAVLDTCCSRDDGRKRLAELCETGRGLPILVVIVKTAADAGYKEEWLVWLLCKACMEDSYFSVLFAELSCCVYESSDIPFTSVQAFLLSLLSNFLTKKPEDVTKISTDFALGIFRVLNEVYKFVDFTSRGNSELPTGSPSTDILGYILTILRDACAWENSSSDMEFSVNSLVAAGLVEVLVGFLDELEPPSIIRKAIKDGKSQAALSANQLKVCPYQGFRRDVVSVIANCTYGRKEVQDKFRHQKKILLILQQCVVDDDNPFLREWGLMAVRNLLEGNLENQHEVSELQLQAPVDTLEITQLGLRVEVDGKSNRAKLVNIS